MVSIKALDALTPADLWREVPREEELWHALKLPPADDRMFLQKLPPGLRRL